MSVSKKLRHLRLITKPQEDRRAHRRIDCCTIVDYATQESLYRNFVTNISTRGLFIDSCKPLPLRQEITIVLSSFEGRQPVKTHGEVVWSSPRGMGVWIKG